MHENICWSNPKNKTCKTCKNENIDYEEYPTIQGHVTMGGMIRTCKDDTANEMLQQEYESLKLDFNGKEITSGYIKPYVNCPFWESKDE